MSAQEQARSLMMRHHQVIKQRQQSMLRRVSHEIGMPAESAEHWSHIQGKPSNFARRTYDRSGASFS